MKRFNILIIDDASMIRDLIKKFVRDYFPNAKIFDANNGQAGKSVLLHQEINMVLCDWEMPEMNGLELLEWLRAEDRFKSLPFVMVTSRGDKEYVMEAINAGVSDYLVKPFNRQQFSEKVERALKRHGIVGKMAHPERAASSSIEVLTGNKVDTTTPTAKKEKKPLPKGVALVRTANGEVKCAVKQLTKDFCLGIFKFVDYLPTVLDQVSVDIEFQQDDEKQVMRINGFVYSITSTENKPDCPLIQIKLSLMDEDPQKHQMIDDYVSQFS
ncbi:response regulator [Pleionea mediterranea]|jgi:DNA-binding response OmpR family regulator|uniref:CheY-like chemotaxis protein n=1 Tax=Pleionea mediterranea TaxID=523701 RepID=A0A316GHM1_9GAMM|nr:response regulator [Pleionea mediterranea]PWK54267.1 CheY-like chemotaxis protein [Pleionea mediterranea]